MGFPRQDGKLQSTGFAKSRTQLTGLTLFNSFKLNGKDKEREFIWKIFFLIMRLILLMPVDQVLLVL